MSRKINLLCQSLSISIMCVATNSYSWNALGHRLVAQIAYHHMSKHAKQVFNHYNHALDSVYRPQNLVNSAAWLDSLRYQNDLWLGPRHYINLPFSLDGTKLIPPDEVNAVSAIRNAKVVMRSNLPNDFEKGFTLRILLHVIGDIHQPLHAVSRFSAQLPEGDKGGNLLPLGNNPVATNLHSYWDKGGGFLTTGKHYSKIQLSQKAYNIEKHWPCNPQKMNLNPRIWAQESHQIAVSYAYQIKAGQKPDKRYQHMVKSFTEKRIALAGCRLAALLNRLA